jgi:proline iminopeptidase
MELGRALLSSAAAVRSMTVLQGWSVADKLGSINAPTLVVGGRYDLLTTPECSKRLATAIPNATLAWFEQSAHFPWLEEPQHFQNVVRDFLVENW